MAPPDNVTPASHNNNVKGVQITWRRSLGEMSIGVLLRKGGAVPLVIGGGGGGRGEGCKNSSDVLFPVLLFLR